MPESETALVVVLQTLSCTRSRTQLLTSTFGAENTTDHLFPLLAIYQLTSYAQVGVQVSVFVVHFLWFFEAYT